MLLCLFLCVSPFCQKKRKYNNLIFSAFFSGGGIFGLKKCCMIDFFLLFLDVEKSDFSYKILIILTFLIFTYP